MYLKYNNTLVIEVPDDTYIVSLRGSKYYLHRVIPVYPSVELKSTKRYKYTTIPLERAGEIVKFFNMYIRPTVVRKSKKSLGVFVYKEDVNKAHWLLKRLYRNVTKIILSRYYVEEFENKYFEYLDKISNLPIRYAPRFYKQIQELKETKNVQLFIEQVISKSLLVLLEDRKKFYELALDVFSFNSILGMFFKVLSGVYSRYFRISNKVISKYAFEKYPELISVKVFPVKVYGVIDKEDIKGDMIVVKDNCVIRSL